MNGTASTARAGYAYVMQPLVTAMVGSTPDGRFSVVFKTRDPDFGWRTRSVGAYPDRERAHHMGHVMVNYLREQILTRVPRIDEQHLDEARQHAECLRTVV
ncbi:MAG: hypothetical protein JWO36_1913 [Myxococcales bacterium]|nr:hypothetical protein [Myxococcales bacterium]